ncbi:hypothetical protein P4B35_06540 [Pontiellaceae bacterium B12227]|nr:hypothetical protein [Pontiellaceae bacterium B12227]
MLILLIGVLLFPFGLFLLVMGLKRRLLAVVGLISMLLSIYPIYLSWEVLSWQYDLLRGWELRLSADLSPYQVTLVQEPGMDFYNSYFEIVRADGKLASVLIDGDDSKWRNPRIIHKDGTAYFVRGTGIIGERTSFVDVAGDSVYSGYYRRTFKLSRLDYKEPRSYRPDTIPKPVEK